MDWNELRIIQEKRDSLKFENHPLFVMVFGVYSRSTSYKRIDYNFLDLLGDVGGVTDSVYIICTMVVVFFCQTHLDYKLIQTFKYLFETKQ